MNFHREQVSNNYYMLISLLYISFKVPYLSYIREFEFCSFTHYRELLNECFKDIIIIIIIMGYNTYIVLTHVIYIIVHFYFLRTKKKIKKIKEHHGTPLPKKKPDHKEEKTILFR